MEEEGLPPNESQLDDNDDCDWLETEDTPRLNGSNDDMAVVTVLVFMLLSIVTLLFMATVSRLPSDIAGMSI